MDLCKKVAGYKSIDEFVTAGIKVIGIGSGSTIAFAVERLAQLNPSLTACIPTSFQAEQLILKHKLPLGTLYFI
jgi:ribose 5-phosphate isomerase A